MFKKDRPDCGSFSLYKKVIREQNLKIHRPKKDKCGRCETFRQCSEVERPKYQTDYDIHREEISEVRKFKDLSKERAIEDVSHSSAVFDLQQNIYLPKSNRGEIFYKRRLACYNFTIYDLASREGFCYLSNETITKRGACEVSSHVMDYLQKLDIEGKESVDFFCDGCAGQNKNSILPAMFTGFLSKSLNIKVITIYYFESNHGQSEGDSMHSEIEQNLARTEEVFHPCQLSNIIEDKPLCVGHVKTSDIVDWKSYGQAMGILKCREAGDGSSIDWTKVKQLKIHKDLANVISFMTSHTQKEFITLTLRKLRNLRSANENTPCPKPELPNAPYF